MFNISNQLILYYPTQPVSFIQPAEINIQANFLNSRIENLTNITDIKSGLGSVNSAAMVMEDMAKINSFPVHYLANKKISKSGKNIEGCQSRISQAKKLLLSCPEAQQLWREVKTQGRFKITCVPESSIPSPSRAQVLLTQRKIEISETQNLFPMVHLLLFELNNLKRAKTFLFNPMCILNKEDYALAGEMIEYDTAKESYKISKDCANNHFWPKEVLRRQRAHFIGQIPDHNWNSFEGYLKTQEEYGHTDIIRTRWKESCDPDNLQHRLKAEKKENLELKALMKKLGIEVDISKDKMYELIKHMADSRMISPDDEPIYKAIIESKRIKK